MFLGSPILTSGFTPPRLSWEISRISQADSASFLARRLHLTPRGLNWVPLDFLRGNWGVNFPHLPAVTRREISGHLNSSQFSEKRETTCFLLRKMPHLGLRFKNRRLFSPGLSLQLHRMQGLLHSRDRYKRAGRQWYSECSPLCPVRFQ